MYEEGFKWWNLGFALGGRLRPVRHDLLRRPCCSCRFARGAGRRHEPRRLLAGRVVAGPRLALAPSRCSPCCGWSRSRSCARARRAASRRRCCPRSRRWSNYRALFVTTGIGRYFLNSLLVATLGTMLSLLFNVTAGYAFAKLRFRGRDGIFQLLRRRAGHPRPGRRCCPVPDAEGDRPGQQLRRRAGAVAGEHLRHLPGPPICAVDPRRDARGGAHRRRERGADLPPRSCCRC